MAGQLGPLAIAEAQALLEEAGLSDLRLELSPYGSYLPLVGLGRAAPLDVTDSLLFDFGNTSVKRGRAHYRAGRLGRVDVWTDLPTVCSDSSARSEPEEEIRQRWQSMVGVIADGWSALSRVERRRTAVGISLACYLIDGHPSPRDRGCYADLRHLSPHLATFVAEELARRLGRIAAVTLMHDGAAAAAAYAGSPRSVVLTLGTAIGNGFPPPADGLWPIEDGRALISAVRP